MQRAIVNLFEKWEINNKQAITLLGRIEPSSYELWKDGINTKSSQNVTLRLSILLGIHKELRLFFKDKTRVYGWIKRPNKDLEYQSALSIMLKGDITDLELVRNYLINAVPKIGEN